ncbi:MAG: hypothetical protein J0M33_05140 [Anaerolineae bacterium]|nr:hypothetical protein [Anaerolineae bacterium]
MGATQSVIAQQHLECGQVYAGVMNRNREVQEFSVNLAVKDSMIADIRVTGGNLRVDFSIVSPNATVLDELDVYYNAAVYHVYNTREVFVPGDYKIIVSGSTDQGGSFELNISCVKANGEVVSSNRSVVASECGSVYENEFAPNEPYHRYYLTLERGTVLKAVVEVIQNSFDLKIDTGVIKNFGSHNERFIIEPDTYYNRATIDSIQTSGLPTTGVYFIIVAGVTSRHDVNQGGNYTLSIGCITPDNVEIQAGTSAFVDLVEQPELASSSTPNTTTSSVTGVDIQSGTPSPAEEINLPAGIPLAETDGGINLPLSLDAPLTVAIAQDIVYTSIVEANAGDTYSIQIQRQSGTNPLGFTVYGPDSVPIFALAMGNSENFTTNLLITSDGVHTLVFYLASLDSNLDPSQAGVYVITLSQ